MIQPNEKDREAARDVIGADTLDEVSIRLLIDRIARALANERARADKLIAETNEWWKREVGVGESAAYQRGRAEQRQVDAEIVGSHFHEPCFHAAPCELIIIEAILATDAKEKP